METIPRDIKLNEFWKHLPYESIINLCQSNIEFNLICQNNSTWQYLLLRDFGVTYNQDKARDLYLLYKHAVEHFSNFYPIITLKALNTLIKIIPVSEWNKLDEAIRQYRDECGGCYTLILSFGELVGVIYDSSYFISGKHIMDEKYRDLIFSIAREHPNLHYPDFDLMVSELDQNNCQKFKKFITKPSIIFVNTKPILINYDYELGLEFEGHTYWPASESCQQQLEEIKNEILDLLK